MNIDFNNIDIRDIALSIFFAIIAIAVFLSFFDQPCMILHKKQNK